MDSLKDLLTKKNMPELVLASLFVLYLVMGYKMPEQAATIVDSTIGKILIVLVALMLFGYSNPILGILALLVAYHLIKSSSVKTSLCYAEMNFFNLS